MKSIFTKTLVVSALFASITAFQVHAGTAFFSHEVTTGSTKQCVYDYLGSTYTVTKKSYEVCPVTIKV